MDAAGAQFGATRALAAARRGRQGSATEIIDAMLAEMAAFTDHRPVHDDVTVIVLKAL